MKQIKLRTTDHSDGMLSCQPRSDTVAGFDDGRMEGTYIISNIPESVTDAEVIGKANKTSFVGTFEADYDQIGNGAIVRARRQG